MQSFHLYELDRARHMFDYEDAAGQAFIQDNRLKSYEWTDTGIKLMMNMDLGKYEGEAATQSDYDRARIEIKNIIGKSFISIDKFYFILQ